MNNQMPNFMPPFNMEINNDLRIPNFPNNYMM